ncbi:MAG: oxidoreductase [Alphaproteobacteria bacterium]|nr:oxidoreductase [Alphaproteobacteria bacterium]|tara:strand:- start:9926 stop:10810 length:885 start_codon:yes stop_codon:yes gene_type:complete
MSEEVAFLGVGAMGGPMAGHLAAAGHKVTVYNRTSAKAEAWIDKHLGVGAATVDKAVGAASFVFSCVGGDDDLRDVTRGEGGAFANMQPGAVFIDHTTTSAAVAREVADKARSLGLNFLDAPIAGGETGAQQGALSIMVGGDPDTFERAAPLLSVYGRSIQHMGPVGAGQLTKMVNQICATGIIQSLAEGLSFAEKAGLDGDRVIEVISNGSAASWQIGNRAKPMLERDFSAGGTVGLLHKDLGIVLDEAERMGASLPVVKLVRSFYEKFVDQGDGNFDAACLIDLLDGRSGDA